MVANIVMIVLTLLGAAAVHAADYASLMKKGDQLLIQGRSSYKEAIDAYTEGIALDPNEVKGYLRRADVYRLLRENEKCIADLDFVLKKDPTHKKALELRSKSNTEVGNLDAAARDYSILSGVYRKAKEDKKSHEAAEASAELMDFSRQLPQIQKNKVSMAPQCVHIVGLLLEKYVKDSISYRLLRAECAIAAKDHTIAAEEVRRVLIKNPNHVDALLLNARELRSLGAIDHAKQQLKRCLEVDPEYAPCRALNKAIKLNAKLQDRLQSLTNDKDWAGVVQHVEEMLTEAHKNRENLDFEQPSRDDMRMKQCDAFVHLREVDKGMHACEEVIQMRGAESENTWEAFVAKGELYTIRDDLDAANRELQNAKQHGGSNQQRVHEFEQKLQKLTKMANRKNYYKILGIEKDATKNQVRKAFRKLALKYHPDKLRDVAESEKERLNTLYRDINEAKEVLLDDEKRQKYDNGEDVFDRSQQQPGGEGFPFFHGGGGFQFHFH